MKEISQKLLSEIATVINQLNKDDFSQNLPILNGNSIGKHIRHILDLFDCLLDSKNGIINYDERKRNPETEIDKAIALLKINQINERIQALNLTEKVILRQNLNHSFCEINSSIERELLYNIEHSVHHSAVIRIGIENNFGYVQLPENFGVAYSTISHREQKVG